MEHLTFLQGVGWAIIGVPIVSFVMALYGFLFGFPLAVLTHYRTTLHGDKSLKSLLFLCFLPLSALYFGIIKPCKTGLRPVAVAWLCCTAGLAVVVTSAVMNDTKKKVEAKIDAIQSAEKPIDRREPANDVRAVRPIGQ